MEEDIKLLEEYIEALRHPMSFKYTNEQKAQAIENLIKGYKELEEEVERRIEQKVLDYRYVDKNMLRKDIIQRDYIPKSKVREIIDTKFISLFEGNTEFPDKGTKMKYVRYVKVSDIEKLLQEGDK